ncbi:DoxX family protein [Spirillospora sp. NPDC048819]|uniref:DoxX family protein n=1 Tax=Spirillospora sp. NPDC048819 TaxID=3155268 RepID=UPI0033F5C500
MTDAETAQLVLRCVVGVTMAAHGVKHARTLDGTAGWFGSIGFRRPRMQAVASAVVEIGAGLALIAGLATPLAAAAVVGTMAVAALSVHVPNGFFITREGCEYVLNLGIASVAIGVLGTGSASVDGAFGLFSGVSGLQGAALVAGLGLAGAAVQLAVFWRRPPTATGIVGEETAEPAAP